MTINWPLSTLAEVGWRGGRDTSWPANSATVPSPDVNDVQPVQFKRREVNKIDVAGEEFMPDQVLTPLMIAVSLKAQITPSPPQSGSYRTAGKPTYENRADRPSFAPSVQHRNIAAFIFTAITRVETMLQSTPIPAPSPGT